MDKLILYKKGSNGSLRYWKIWQDTNSIEVRYGVQGGQELSNNEIIDFGLAGRTQQEQIELRIKSMINKKVDSGYVFDLEKATSVKNGIGLPKPMLAKPFEKNKTKLDICFAQRKYDGHRCLIKIKDNSVFAYSRNGKEITSIGHIKDELKELGDVILDGELYHHGTPLQTISSWIKKEQPESKELIFICYDIASSHSPYEFRLSNIKDLLEGLANSLVANTALLIGDFDPDALARSYMLEGYEGAILRVTNSGYEAGKRSRSLLKVKTFFDDEFVVEQITSGVDGQAILHMRIDGKLFSATCHGTLGYKKYVFNNKDDFIGMKVNIKYSGFTKAGIPFHPVATMWRDKDAE